MRSINYSDDRLRFINDKRDRPLAASDGEHDAFMLSIQTTAQ
jgi:hypothetical protein